MATDRTMRLRLLKDSFFKQMMTFGGLSVIIAISVIFFFLLSVVFPVFAPATIDSPRQYPELLKNSVMDLGSSEGREIVYTLHSSGALAYREFDTGKEIASEALAIPSGTEVTAVSNSELSASRITAAALSNGSVIVFKASFKVDYPNGVKTITPQVEYPLGKDPIKLSEVAIKHLAFQVEGDRVALVALDVNGLLTMASIETTTNLITQETAVSVSRHTLTAPSGAVTALLINARISDLYVLHSDRMVSHHRLSVNGGEESSPEMHMLWQNESKTTAAALLSGGSSLIVANDRGQASQWFNVRKADNSGVQLTQIRDFKSMPSAVTAIGVEYFRKGFALGDSKGNVGLYYATSNRQLEVVRFSNVPIEQIEITPRGNGIVVLDSETLLRASVVENEHPEVSFSSLWQPVWYESYEKPEYIWQSTAATDDFEPKLSLAPLTYGTLKAAFYAMLISIPLAIGAAICSAYFMAPKMRQIVKPSVEIMEALPTVILGFLAGLWLAPLVEANLMSTLLLFIVIPISFVVAAWVYEFLPGSVTRKIPAGWETLMLIPVCALAIWVSFLIGGPAEEIFFAGDLPNFLSNELGIKYEQRNSLVVGIAMGFAVTPTIYSIAEDAIFSVPKHLTSGSLALGATPWQTLTRVVLLTASPGIFSAIMIGLGRAVGETMIVLMATGNTAVMDLSIFEGFRTLSANIGVEMPEAAVGTTHYRLLFMSALVLFIFTFFVNTLAEIVRHRLREKYSSI